MAGSKKLNAFDSTVAWFGNEDWGLGLPFPELMAFLATWTEVLGAILILLGLAVSWVSIPLMITMLVAALSVHWQNGWLAIAEGNGIFAGERSIGAIERLGRAKEILQEHGQYSWLTENGSFVVLRNGNSVCDALDNCSCIVLLHAIRGVMRHGTQSVLT